jgi:hypothetical protein
MPGRRVRLLTKGGGYGRVIVTSLLELDDLVQKLRDPSEGVFVRTDTGRVIFASHEMVAFLPSCPECNDDQIEPGDYLCIACRYLADQARALL